jgi:hypothetical protein
MGQASQSQRSIWLLFCCQALLNAVAIGQVAMSALIGHSLALDKTLGTLPTAMQMAATMLASVPASVAFARLGRRAGFLLGAAAAACGLPSIRSGRLARRFRAILRGRRADRAWRRNRAAPALCRRRGRGCPRPRARGRPGRSAPRRWCH